MKIEVIDDWEQSLKESILKNYKNSQMIEYKDSNATELLEKAYDARIAKMMSAYFYEMKIVLEGLHHHTKPNGVVCIDIGDSVYANVYIPTHKILTEIAKDLGFLLYEEIVLRKRYSNGGAELGQYLLVFKKMDNDEK